MELRLWRMTRGQRGMTWGPVTCPKQEKVGLVTQAPASKSATLALLADCVSDAAVAGDEL